MNLDRTLFRSLVACITVFAAPAFSESPSPSALAWRVPSACGSAESVETRLQGILGDRTPKTFPAFEGGIEEIDDGFKVSLEVTKDGKTYTRMVSARTCEAALEVSALLIALQVDPSRVLASDDPTVRSSMESPAETEEGTASAPDEVSTQRADSPQTRIENAQTTKAENTAAPSPKSESDQEGAPKGDERAAVEEDPLSFSAGLTFAADVGFLGSFSPGVSLFGGLRRRKFATEWSVQYLPPFKTEISDHPHALWSASMVSIFLGVGTFHTLKDFCFSPLLGIAAHGMFAESKGVDSPGKDAIWTASAWLAVSLEWQPLSRFGLRLQPALHYLFTRPIFTIDGIGPVYQSSPAAGVFNFGVFFDFD